MDVITELLPGARAVLCVDMDAARGRHQWHIEVRQEGRPIKVPKRGPETYASAAKAVRAGVYVLQQVVRDYMQRRRAAGRAGPHTG